MGWVDELNQWVMKHVRPAAIRRVETERDGTTLIRADGSQFILRWSEVQEIAVLKLPSLAIDSFALVILTAGSSFEIVEETVPGYEELCQEIPRRLEGVVPYEKWALELMASSQEQESGKVIFRRAAS